MKQVFIGGSERSGTTMLGAMLGAHSSAICTPESQFIISTLRKIGQEGDFAADARLILDKLSLERRFVLEWNVDLSSPFAQKSNEKIKYSDLIELIVKIYSKKNGIQDPGIWIDHTPLNIRYGSILLQLFPKAKMLHLVRDGRAVAASQMREWKIRSAANNSRYWIERLAFGLAAESFWGTDRVMRVKYEELVLNPALILKKICRFVEIDYEESMIEGGGFRPVLTFDKHKLVGKRPSADRIHGWRNELTNRDIELFELIAHDMLVYLGYELLFGFQAKPYSIHEKFIDTIHDSALRPFIFKFFHYRRYRRFKKITQVVSKKA